jgi:hypothetical protein
LVFLAESFDGREDFVCGFDPFVGRGIFGSEDETEIRAGEGTGGTGRERHPVGDTPAILSRVENSHRARDGAESIAELCRREGIVQNLYYRWSKDFLEAGKKRLAGDTARAATSDEVKDLRREPSALKGVVAELTLENRLLKKYRDRGWGGRTMRYPASEKPDDSANAQRACRHAVVIAGIGIGSIVATHSVFAEASVWLRHAHSESAARSQRASAQHSWETKQNHNGGDDGGRGQA